MKKFKLIRVIANLLIVASLLVLNPVGVNADWKVNNNKWYYTEGNSKVTGWKLIDGSWYYFYSDGHMATNTTIDGYHLSYTGTLVSNVPVSKEKSNLDYLGQEILENISAQKPLFHIKYYGDINNADKAIKDSIDKLKYTNPNEYYNLSSYNGKMSSWSGSTSVDVTINCVYKMTAEMVKDLDTRAKVIVANITSDSMTLTEKERAIHDWIINNTEYDKSYKIYDPYNTLIKHTGVCEGYSLLAHKMFTIAGIKSIVIQGYGDGVAHGWNMVNLYGKWYHVDLTWDDPVSSENVLQYDYYNLTDSQIRADHTWDTSKYPSAN